MENTINSQLPVKASPAAVSAAGQVQAAAARRGQLYLTFALGAEVFAIEIPRIREIIEYTDPTMVPMLPPSLRGVINVRGAVVPVVDLAVRFGWTPTAVGRRTSIVIVEIEHNGEKHVLGLVVDRVYAVTEIPADDIEPAPVFGARINTDFIAGMARNAGHFVIVLDIERALSVVELAAVATVAADAN
ncbi:MAG: chemotaxis protein CheW [Propionivibrio sp.]